MREPDILAELQDACNRDSAWMELAGLLLDDSINVHLAIMIEPFLEYLLTGRKVIESRFSRNAITPFGSVKANDLVFLKAGPVVGCFRVASAEFVILYEGELQRVRERYAEQICAETDEFWDARAEKRYATLISVAQVWRLPPVKVPKRDMRGWVVVRRADAGLCQGQLALL